MKSFNEQMTEDFEAQENAVNAEKLKIIERTNPPIKNYHVFLECSMTNCETLIWYEGYNEPILVVILCSDISGNKAIIKSTKNCVCIYINNRSEKWYRRFGITIHLGSGIKQRVKRLLRLSK